MKSKKLALVTGSSRGIGKAIALTLAKDGFDIVVNCSKSKKQGEEVGEEIGKIGRQAYLVMGDITNEAQAQNIFKQMATIAPQLDLLVNNAGFDYGHLIEDYTIPQMREIVEIILIAKMTTTKYALPLLKKSPNPSIINIASRMGREKTIETVGAYGPAEAGVIKFTQCCALEFRKYKIRVNCVAPGLTETELTRNMVPEESFWKEQARINPRGRVGTPQDVANVVSFLSSEKADYINGETIGVNGGSVLI